MTKKPLLVLVMGTLLVAVAAGAAALLANRDRESTEPGLTLYGNVEIRQLSLAFEGTGRLLALHAEEGDSVWAGAVVAELDTRTLALQAEEAAYRVVVLEQSLQRLRNGARPEEVAQARSRLAGALAEQERARQEHERLAALAAHTQGEATSPQALEAAAAALQLASARSEEHRQALQLTLRGARAEDLAGAEAQWRAARAQHALLQHQIDQGTLRAPADGVVRSRLLEPGDLAQPQRPVLVLALNQPQWVRTYVEAPQLGRIAPGMAATITTDDPQQPPVQGQVGFIASVAEFTPKNVQTEALRTSLVYEVRVVVQAPATVPEAAGETTGTRASPAAGPLRHGQAVTVRLHGAQQ